MRAFNECGWREYANNRQKYIEKEISSQKKEYILNVDEQEFVVYLTNKYRLEELTIDYEGEIVRDPRTSNQWVEDRTWGERYKRDLFTFTVCFPFVGSPELFRIQPTRWTMVSRDITIDASRKVASFTLEVWEKDPKKFHDSKRKAIHDSFTNLTNINSDVRGWNSRLSALVEGIFQRQKKKYLEENSFFEAINLKTTDTEDAIFSVPTVRKREIPKPQTPATKTFTSEPSLAGKVYQDILAVVSETGQKMERKPSLYQGKDEEALRDQFLFVLEDRYEGTSGTGETFNRQGKTDILLKYAADGSNIFVAECKKWGGRKVLFDAIDQLLGYLTWRDSKSALMLFVENQSFSQVLEVVADAVPAHPQCLKLAGRTGETRFSFEFSFPGDPDRLIFIEVIAFHFPK